jgi:hypothetical protein
MCSYLHKKFYFFLQKVGVTGTEVMKRVTAGEGGGLQWPSKLAHHGGLRRDLKRGKRLWGE